MLTAFLIGFVVRVMYTPFLEELLGTKDDANILTVKGTIQSPFIPHNHWMVLGAVMAEVTAEIG